MFEGFTRTEIDTSGARIHLRHGGDGPPLLLLHGNPLTHVSWHKIAGRLADQICEADRTRGDVHHLALQVPRHRRALAGELRGEPLKGR